MPWIWIVLQSFKRIKIKGLFEPLRHHFICHQKPSQEDWKEFVILLNMSNKFDIDWLQTQGFLKTLLIFIWWNEPHPTLSLIFLTSCRSCPTNKIQSWRILKGWQLTSISLCSSVYCWHPVTRIAEELGWQPEQSSIRKLILFVNISAAACSRTRSRCQCGTRGQRQSTILHSNSKVEIFGYGRHSMREDIGRRLKRTFIALCPLCVHQLCCHWNAIQFLADHDQYMNMWTLIGAR